MIIGKFTKVEGTNGNLDGIIETLHGEIGARFIPATKGADYDVQTDSGCDLGAAWKKTSGKGTTYHSVQLDSPLLPKPINCVLFEQNDGSFHLVWERPKPAQNGQQA
jgi:uncharacterized protein (DUF736 family)